MTAKAIRAQLRKEAQAINERNRVPGDLYYKPSRSERDDDVDNALDARIVLYSALRLGQGGLK